MLDNAQINLGLKEWEFWEMTFVGYLRLCIHYAKKEASKWEHTRLIYSIIYNTNVEKKSQQIKPKKEFPLWTDRLQLEEIKPKPIPTEEEKSEMLKRVKKDG